MFGVFIDIFRHQYLRTIQNAPPSQFTTNYGSFVYYSEKQNDSVRETARRLIAHIESRGVTPPGGHQTLSQVTELIPDKTQRNCCIFREYCGTPGETDPKILTEPLSKLCESNTTIMARLSNYTIAKENQKALKFCLNPQFIKLHENLSCKDVNAVAVFKFSSSITTQVLYLRVFV